MTQPLFSSPALADLIESRADLISAGKDPVDDLPTSVGVGRAPDAQTADS